MNLFFKCKKCEEEFEISFDSSLSDSEGATKQLEKLTQILIEKGLCLNCYEKTIESNQQEAERIKDEMKQIDVMRKRIEEEINDPQFQSILSLNFDELQQTLESSNKKYNDFINESDELEKNLNTCVNELKQLQKIEKEKAKEFFLLEEKTFSINRTFSIERGILEKNRMFQDNMLNNTNNIFDDLFQIAVNEKYGIINGCRMACLNGRINYHEISCGWGHIILLTEMLIKKFTTLIRKKFNFIDQMNYELFALGNFSYFVNLKTKKEYLFYWNSEDAPDSEKVAQLNETMKEFLNVMKYLDKLIKTVNETQEINTFPINIEKNGINGVSISIDLKDKNQNNFHYNLKYLLIFLKRAIAFALKFKLINISKMHNIDS